MAGILDGKSMALAIKDELRREVVDWKARGYTPKLAVLLAGADPASQAYLAAKQRVCHDVGMVCDVHVLADLKDTVALQAGLLALIERLNADEAVGGILVEMPLPAGVDKGLVLAALDPDKDVDGMSPVNRSRILSGEDGLFPATPMSCLEMLLRGGVRLAGKHVVVVGRGETVGKPLVFMLLRHNPTVTICHSHTRDLGTVTRLGDVVITAVGRPGLLRGDMVRPGAVVVDAGTTPTDEGLRGDVVFDEVAERASLITPVPGGVGALTTVLLLQNVLKGMDRRFGS
ncbi:MAG: bifunctional 5,10-methylenetetrahydrofolate dehydrogenase/5,10-methenyltetrahydrofolate cyclohydrolase [Gracilibacteraceae bacterium]|jgi:methylenetetrahydrofolate dehydrogenase (NADP+)/methenyltetrahydrofolate cyclohydrolase|nr:bifunctional 5,10-methylenetetrahydrofolate dehydrogenase/5,10-methenyltetrahydrofolate cyclohydrolase [Gracilibacteraceae bacterium]